MKKLPVITAYLASAYWLLASWPAAGADLPAYKAAPVPVIQNYSFYVGGYGSFGLLPTDSQSSVFAGPSPIIAITNGTVRGWPSTPSAGLSVGYFNTSFGTIGWGLAADIGYDFSRGCLTNDCVTARKNGWSSEQALEIGINITGLNGLQPVPLPAPSGVPPTTWSNAWLLVRGGAFERLLDLCGFGITQIDPTGAVTNGITECGTKIVAAPMVGTGFRFQITPQLGLNATWSHVFWGNGFQQTTSTPVNGLTDVQSVTNVKVSHEDIFKLKLSYFLF